MSRMVAAFVLALTMSMVTSSPAHATRSVSTSVSTSVSASANMSAAKDKGIGPDTMCFVCGAWFGLCVVLCPVTRPCVSPLFEVIACTGGECFKGIDDGDCLSGFGSEAGPGKPREEVAPPNQNRGSPSPSPSSPSSPDTPPPGGDDDGDDPNVPDRPPIDVRPVPTSFLSVMRY